MARTSTPLSCLTCYCLFLAAASADTRKNADSSAAVCTDTVSWTKAAVDQDEGLELLQRHSMQVDAKNKLFDGRDWHPEAPWQCHSYEQGQDDLWCTTVGRQGGYEYQFNDGEEGQCGDCWCCKRPLVNEVVPARMLEQEDQDGPEWQCHKYDKGQGNHWCIEMASKDDQEYEYTYTAGKVNLTGCGDCWCCSRSGDWRREVHKVPRARAIRPPDQAVMRRSEAVTSRAWMCHSYTGTQSDDWCATVGNHEGYDYEFNGGKNGQCGDCWCCKREAEKKELVAAVKLEEKDEQWQCHNYNAGQNDDWCASAGTQGGHEYAFKSGQCGDCWCCKRKASTPLQASTPLKASTPLQASTPKATDWQCYNYNEEQNNDWCITMSDRKLPDFEFAFTGGKVDLCGDCWCCRRGRKESSTVGLAQIKTGVGLAQITSGRVAAVGAAPRRHAQPQDEWQCHNYGPGQSDQWCETVGMHGGHEYEFQSGRCGDCWCCKREIQELAEYTPPKKTRKSRELAPAKSRVVERAVEPWQCHAYLTKQNNDWCISMSNQDAGEYEYAYTGGQVELCGDCWCCKRSAGFRLSEQVREAEQKAVSNSDAWTCHTYTHKQNNDWCMTAGIQGGFEYAFNGGSYNQCGDCWCCKRKATIMKPMLSAVSHASQKVARRGHSKHSGSWECHDYDKHQKQDDAWCDSVKTHGGYEYTFTGGASELCGECWCCKRRL